MNKKLFILGLLSITIANLTMAFNIACGPPPYKDSRVAPYIKEFEETYHVDASFIEARLADGDLLKNQPDVVGLCEMGKRRVSFKREFWNVFGYQERKLLVFHELGHCVFNKDHRDDFYTDGCPKSIMATFLITESCFMAHHSDLIKELGENRE